MTSSRKIIVRIPTLQTTNFFSPAQEFVNNLLNGVSHEESMDEALDIHTPDWIDYEKYTRYIWSAGNEFRRRIEDQTIRISPSVAALVSVSVSLAVVVRIHWGIYSLYA